MSRKRVFCTDWKKAEEKEVRQKKWMCDVTIVNKNGEEEHKLVPGKAKGDGAPISKAYSTKVALADAREILKKRAEKAAKKGTGRGRKRTTASSSAHSTAASSSRSTAASSARSSAHSTAHQSAAVSDSDYGMPVLMDDDEPAAPVSVQRKRTALFPNHQKKAGPKKPKRITKGLYV